MTSGRGLVALIRHGETAGNAGRVVQLPDTPLNERGIAQARALAERLHTAGFPIERIVASDLRRAAMTAELVCERLAVPLEFEALLHERNFGALRGTAYADLATDLFAADYAPPEGESWPAFHARVAHAWREVRRRSAECRRGALVVVTHGLVCGALVERELGHAASPGGDGPRFGNTSLTLLRANAGGAWGIELLGCTAHLSEAALGGGGAAIADDVRAISGS